MSAAGTSGRTVAFAVEGMSCASCARAVEELLGRTPGVREARVAYASGTAEAVLAGEHADLDAAVARAEARGYRLRPLTEAGDRGREAGELRELQARLAVAAFFGASTMTVALLLHLDAFATAPEARLAAATSGLLALPAVLIGGWPFARRAALGLRDGVLGMDLLVALGAASAFALSTALLLAGSANVFFDTAAMIVVFLLVGRVLERSARHRALDAIRSLLSLLPPTATRVEPDRERAVEVDQIAVGDRVRVRPGERVPVDGRIVEGRARVDRSLLTGESAPAAVGIGDAVEAGVISLDGTFVARVEATAGQRAVDHVRRAMARFLASRAPTQDLADRVARVLIPAVLTLAGLTALAHLLLGASPVDAVLTATAVVVVACPCALGLATPLALVVAAGRAARRGIVFRDGSALERAASVRAVAFDKTGTLTEGRPHLASLHPAAGVADQRLLALAAGVEAHSTHVLARAVRDAAHAAGLEPLAVDDPRTVPGLGVRAESAAGTVRVGSDAFLREAHIAVPPLDLGEGTAVHVAEGARWLGALRLEDRLRPSTRAAVRALEGARLDIALLTGDAPRPAHAVAHRIGLDPARVLAAMRPLDKAHWIAERAPRPIAFVGDGINDGPALAAADLGVAVDEATDVALGAADLVLRRGGVGLLPESLALARRTRAVMRQNLLWALAYNALAIPAAMAGAIPPAVAALAMAASSLTVVLSSMRLAGSTTTRRRLAHDASAARVETDAHGGPLAASVVAPPDRSRPSRCRSDPAAAG